MKKEQRAGLIDTISLGYGLVTRRPWLLVVPVLLDLFLWFGPRLPAPQLLDQLATTNDQVGEVNRQILVGQRLIGPDSDLFALLASQVPSMLVHLRPDQPSLQVARPVLQLGDMVLAGLGLLMAIGSLWLAMLYWVPIAQVVRGERLAPLELGRRAGRAGLVLLVLSLMLMVVGLAIGIPIAIVIGVAALAGYQPIVALLTAIVLVGFIWLAIHLAFTVDAIVISQAGPVRAVRYSLAVVRSYFWATVGLIILSRVIAAGLSGIVFVALASTTVGVPIAIVANAYITTGLVAAGMIFYRDRSPIGRPGGVTDNRSTQSP